MDIPVYSTIRLTTDRYNDLGVKKGDTGVVLEVYDYKGYEVEFMDAKGNTLDCFGVEPSEVELVEEASTAKTS